MDERAADLLRNFLDGVDQPCPACKYNLRNLTGTRCPECGEDLVLQVGVTEPKLAACIAGVIALAAGAGLNGLLLVYFFIRYVFFSDRFILSDTRLSVTLVAGVCFEGIALVLWLRYWRRIRRASSATKTFLSLACWLLTAIDLFIFSANVR